MFHSLPAKAISHRQHIYFTLITHNYINLNLAAILILWVILSLYLFIAVNSRSYT